jgi:hypothetical protein
LQRELLHLVEADLLVLDKIIRDLSTRVVTVDKKAEMFVVDLSHGFEFILFGLRINRENFLSKCSLLKRFVASLHSIKVLLAFTLAQVRSFIDFILTEVKQKLSTVAGMRAKCKLMCS